jgi:UDP-N-acetylmuramoyl-L-alanyl-D-glutamate--2,6-diaminopimelate ligase
MLRSIIDAAGERCGLVSSLGFCDGAMTRSLGAGFDPKAARFRAGTASCGGRVAFTARELDPHSLTHGTTGLPVLLSEMVELGCKAAVLEASSGALAHRSFEGIAFHGAVVTDVAAPLGFPEDLLLRRRRAKARLFRQVVPGGVAVVNANDPHAEILGAINLDARRVAFGVGWRPGRSSTIDVSAQLIRLDLSGTRLVLRGFNQEAAVHLPLVGPRIATCAVAAAALAWALEIDRAAVVAGLEAVESIAGHLEKVDQGQDFDVRIDAAQTPEALGEALAALKAIAVGRVHCVMSAEGGGDRMQRRRLAEVADFAADRVILTISNPRTEDPNQILDDLLAGFQHPGKVRIEPDRRTAIHVVLDSARAGDVVLIAGKGHNAYQIFADRVVAFHDDLVVRQWLRSRAAQIAQKLA